MREVSYCSQIDVLSLHILRDPLLKVLDFAENESVRYRQISPSSLSHFRSVFLHRVIHFGENLGDKVRVRSPKKLKNLIEVP